jgi:hypothetical protein
MPFAQSSDRPRICSPIIQTGLGILKAFDVMRTSHGVASRAHLGKDAHQPANGLLTHQALV